MADVMPAIQQYSTNKWIRFALSAAATLCGFLAAYNWADIVDSKTAGLIVMGIGILKMIIDAISPGAGVTTVPQTGSGIAATVFTHKSVVGPTTSIYDGSHTGDVP